MNVKIGAKIKTLRKSDDITQEQLAEVIGITSQAISRWESENGYPDIEYISPIANFLNVSIDYLFDHDLIEKKRKMEDYNQQYKVLGQDRTQSQDEQISLMRQALAEFPAEEILLVNLAYALYWKWYNSAFHRLKEDRASTPSDKIFKSDSSWEEPVKIMEELLSSSSNDFIRARCRETLAYMYGCIGENEKLRVIAEQCGSLLHAKETILAATLPGEAGIKCKQELLLVLIHVLANTIQFIVDPADVETSVEAHLTIINLFNVVFRGDYGGHIGRMSLLYTGYATALRAVNPDEAFNVKTSEKPFTSPYLNRLTYNMVDFVRGEVALLLGAMKNEGNQYLREYPEFMSLINDAEAWMAESDRL